jgi:hypothetical protein
MSVLLQICSSRFRCCSKAGRRKFLLLRLVGFCIVFARLSPYLSSFELFDGMILPRLCLKLKGRQGAAAWRNRHLST